MAAYGDEYYDGFRIFVWLADIVGLPIDQMNFLITQFAALGLASILRTSLSPNVVTPAIRHAFGLIVGLAFGYFCFGKQAVHLAGLPALCYIVMRTQDPKIMQRMVLAVALFYLSCIHFHRQLYDYGSYTLDITGPLMVITQKVTSLAFNVHDGFTRRDDELTPSQRYYAIRYVLFPFKTSSSLRLYIPGATLLRFRKLPTALEYFSYVFHFQALMAGPIIFYRDYIDFIHGSKIRGAKSLTGYHDERSGMGHEIILEPSPGLVVIKKVLGSLMCAIIFVNLIPSFPIQRIKDDEFLEKSSFLYKFWYLMIATMLVRFKYYHAWLFADAICNESGLGFNGYDETGKLKWDLVSNVDVIKFETSLSLKDAIEQWNKGTNRWLRMIVYERVKKNGTILTYALSAIWHGFYPGYYLTFASGALFTFASRAVRRNVRPLFLGTRTAKFFYDVLTFIATRLVMAYCTFSFILLEFMPSIRLYLSLYLVPHILGLVALVVLPRFMKLFSSSNRGMETHGVTQETPNGHAHKIY
ncbi:lysophospholipid acyltransferase 1 isoform X5 [Cephus cinctus]|uniref:Lysophospholipid acyltransferase 1 isoform X5 n=1 Tax=Cephus cinctus TaxID=211228 RepID=A0AAJ7BS83_CEPCN|nr:lysophospholipid acyltransferase 1 isoform X5 [Cephus cinctus]